MRGTVPGCNRWSAWLFCYRAVCCLRSCRVLSGHQRCLCVTCYGYGLRGLIPRRTRVTFPIDPGGFETVRIFGLRSCWNTRSGAGPMSCVSQ